MKAIAIVGNKNSGKTGLTLKLAETLSGMGLKVVAAKHTKHHFDKADTDTDRMRRVCAGVIGLCPDESFVTWPGERKLSDLVPLVNADVLLLEGGKEIGWLPRVLTLKNEEEAGGLTPELALACWGNVGIDGVPMVDDVRELAHLVLERGFILPGLDCGACGYTKCEGLAASIVAGEGEMGQCKSRAPEISITLNGSSLDLNPFVAGIFSAGIKGMMSQLKGYAPGDVEIKMTI